LVRHSIVAEAHRRGHTAEEWWADICSQVPGRFQAFSEGSKGWSLMAFWLLFREPTDRWERLGKALHYSAVKDAEQGTAMRVSLPPRLGSPERIEAVARATGGVVSEVYAGYYQGVADVAMAVSDELLERGRGRSSDILREAAYLWVLRSRAMKGGNVHIISKSESLPSDLHTRVVIPGGEVDVHFAPAPYRAVHAYVAHVRDSKLVGGSFKSHVRHFRKPALSAMFSDYKDVILPCKESKCTKYLIRPWELGEDMERAWRELREDVKKGVMTHALPAVAPATPPRIEFAPIGPPVARLVVPTHDYFDMLASLGPDEVDWAEEVYDSLTEEKQDELLEMRFDNVREFRKLLLSWSDDSEPAEKKLKETVG
jgi:hypothetical protein